MFFSCAFTTIGSFPKFRTRTFQPALYNSVVYPKPAIAKPWFPGDSSLHCRPCSSLRGLSPGLVATTLATLRGHRKTVTASVLAS